MAHRNDRSKISTDKWRYKYNSYLKLTNILLVSGKQELNVNADDIKKFFKCSHEYTMIGADIEACSRTPD